MTKKKTDQCVEPVAVDAGKKVYIVAEGRAIVGRKRQVNAGKRIVAEDVRGGQRTLDELVNGGFVVEKKA